MSGHSRTAQCQVHSESEVELEDTPRRESSSYRPKLDAWVHHRRTVGLWHRQRSSPERLEPRFQEEGLERDSNPCTCKKLELKVVRANPFVDESHRPQDRSSNKGETKAKWGFTDTKEYVAICIIKARGKRLSLRWSKKQVAQDVKNDAKIVIENVKNNESTIVEKDVRSEIPLAVVRFPTNPTFKASIRISLYKSCTASRNVFNRHKTRDIFK